jgi:hypothetical protein
MNSNKKGQLFIIGGFFIMLSLVFIYSLETDNHYIISSSKSSLLSNIIDQTCQVATLSNGSYIDTRFTDLETKTNQYCNSINLNCDLVISKSLGAPINLSELDYTYYNYSIYYKNEGFSYNNSFRCD